MNIAKKFILGFFTIKQVQKDLYSVMFYNSDRVVTSDGITPLQSFTSRKEAREYILNNWSWLKQYN